MYLKNIEQALQHPDLKGGMDEVRLTVELKYREFHVQLKDTGWRTEHASAPSLEEALRAVFRAHGIEL